MPVFSDSSTTSIAPQWTPQPRPPAPGARGTPARRSAAREAAARRPAAAEVLSISSILYIQQLKIIRILMIRFPFSLLSVNVDSTNAQCIENTRSRMLVFLKN